MMRNVDTLNRETYYKVVYTYSVMAYTLQKQDCEEFSSAYSVSVLSSLIDRGKYSVKSRIFVALVRATATDLTIMLVSCCHFASNRESSEATLVSFHKSSTISMVNCNTSCIDSMVN